jgi:hypothetical protein
VLHHSSTGSGTYSKRISVRKVVSRCSHSVDRCTRIVIAACCYCSMRAHLLACYQREPEYATVAFADRRVVLSLTNIWDCLGWEQESRNRDDQTEKRSKWAGSFEVNDKTGIEEAWQLEILKRNERTRIRCGGYEIGCSWKTGTTLHHCSKALSMLVGQGVLIKLGVSRTGCANRCLVMMYGVFSSSQTGK